MTDRTVQVRLIARIDQWTKAMHDAGKDVSKVGVQTETSSKKADASMKKLGKSAQTNGKMLALGVTAAAYGAYKLVDSASALNETTSKMGVVFGKSTGQVTAWAANSAKSMGLSTQAAEESAATFGNLFVSMGLAQNKSADMSTAIVKLGGDLASFNNTDPAEAVDALRSGLVGETEPLRKFGVNLNEVGIKAEAMKLGLYNGTGQISASARAQAAYALILEQTKTAQGDFARTSDGVANSQRIAAAEFENTKAAIGADLLPAFNDLLHAGTGVLTFFNGLPKPIRTGVEVLGALGIAAKVVGPAIFSMRASILEARVAQATLTTSTVTSTVALEAEGAAAVATGGKMSAMSGFAKKAGLALIGISVAGRAINSATNGGLESNVKTYKELADNAELMDLKFTDAFSQFGNNSDKIITASDNIGAAFFGIKSSAEVATESMKGYDAQMASLVGSGNLQEAAGLWQKLVDVGKNHGVTTQQLTDLFPQYAKALADVDAKNKGVIVSTDGLVALFPQVTTNFGASTVAANKAAAATTGLTAGQLELNAAVKAASVALAADITTLEGKKRAQYDALDADAKAAIAIRDLGKQHKITNQQVRDTARLVYDAADAQVAAGKGSAGYRAELVNLRNSVKKGSPLRKELDGFIVALDRAAAKRQIDIVMNFIAHNAPAIFQKGQAPTYPGVTLHPAGGGLVKGPGTGTSDSIPAMVSNGEVVINAAAAAQFGVKRLLAINAGKTLTPMAASGGSSSSTLDTSSLLTAARALVDAADRMQSPAAVYVGGREIATTVRDQNLRDSRRT